MIRVVFGPMLGLLHPDYSVGEALGLPTAGWKIIEVGQQKFAWPGWTRLEKEFDAAVKGSDGRKVELRTNVEFLIVRAQRMVRANILPKDEVEFVFVSASYTIVVQHDEDGDFLTEIPGGFFEEAFHQLFASDEELFGGGA